MGGTSVLLLVCSAKVDAVRQVIAVAGRCDLVILNPSGQAGISIAQGAWGKPFARGDDLHLHDTRREGMEHERDIPRDYTVESGLDHFCDYEERSRERAICGRRNNSRGVFCCRSSPFFFPDKATAGGLKNFRKYTGLVIDDGTTFGLSPLGEAYLNYGVVGGIGFMLVFGGCFAIFYYGTLRFALKQPTFLFWIPLIFYQAMKAETELLVILNQLIKGSMVAFGGITR